MPTQYGSVNVDERYAAILEPNLYGDAILQPGMTFNAQHQGEANSGLVKIYKSTRDSAADPGQSAGDFTHEAAANALIDLRLNNAFRKSKKIYRVAANAVAYSLAEETLSTAVRDNQEDWQQAGLACLVKEGTALSDETALTKDNIKSHVISARKTLRKAHARPDVVIASVDTYACMLEAAGSQYTPNTNENVLTTGRVGRWLGMTWYEGDLLDKETARYYDYAGTLQEVDLTDVDFIMYDHRTFHCVNNLEAMRLVDALDFVGSYAQNEINSGFRVSTAAMVAVKRNVQLDALTVTSTAGASGKTALTVTPASLPGHTYKYKTDASTAPTVTYDQVLTTGWTAWDGVAEITATTNHKITVAEVDAGNKAKKAGNATITSGA